MSLLGLRVEPTNLRKREFMDDIQRGAFLAGTWSRRGEGGRRGWRERQKQSRAGSAGARRERGRGRGRRELQVRLETARGRQAGSGSLAAQRNERARTANSSQTEGQTGR